MSHPQQLRQLGMNQPQKSHESSFLSTTSCRCSSFASKSLSYSSNQHQNSSFHQNLFTPCTCLNVLSTYCSKRRWSSWFNSCGPRDHHLSFMASEQQLRPLSFNMPLEIARRKKISRQQKKEELEREVSMLQNMLEQEETMHEIMERTHHVHYGSSISIPNFLPPKVKELLAELAMVEGEITRLEDQISQLQLGLKHEQEVTTKETKSKQWQLGSLSNLQRHSTNMAIISSPMINKVGNNEKVAFETKALRFISKAIKGDYNLSDFSVSDQQKMGKSKVVFVDQKENQFQHEVKFQDRIPRKSGIIKPAASPLRDRRHPTPKPRERNPTEITLELPPKSLSNSILLEESIQSWQPNKLSESILKCLNFICVRLLRTSRAMELEKSGPISRSMHSSIFRSAETSLNSKSSNIMLQKDSRQQDPYGIFDMEESILRDIGPYKNLVIFSANSMDPKCISSSSYIPLLRKLRVLMKNLQTVDVKVLTCQQKLAFWINMFNACIMHGFLQYGVPNSLEKLIALMNKATLCIGGNTINAQAIEHYILRGQASSNLKEAHQRGEMDDKEALIRKLYGLESTDPNVTFALCYGTRSSPAVRIYTADGVVAELEKSKLEYLQASIMVRNTRKIAIPELLFRNILDFAMDIDTLVEWICHQLPTSGSLRKSMVDCFRQQGHNSTGKISITVEKIPYDFEFQYLLAI